MKTRIELSSGSTAALDTDPDERGQRPTVLLVPGYTGSKEDFLPLLGPLSASGYRAVAIDQRGQFESSWARSEDDYRTAALSSDICELADRLGRRAPLLHLVGHSWGGLVGRAAVLARADLFDSFTLMSSGPGAIGGERGLVIDVSEPVLIEHGMAVLWERMVERSQTDPKWIRSTPAARAFLRDRFMANDPAGLRAMGRQLRTIDDRTAQLRDSSLPLLVLHGEDEDAWPPDVQRDMADRLGADLVVIQGAAHSPAVENPSGTVSALLAFWQRTGRGSGQRPA